MQWPEYKALCDSADVWSRWMLEQTAELLAGAERAQLLQVLDERPLVKPADHKGGPATDMFRVSLSGALVEAIASRVVLASRRGEETSGTRGRGLGGFAEAWGEFRDFKKNGRVEMSDVVMTMIDAFNRKDMDGIIACFAEDAVYHNIPMEPIHGTAGIRAGLEGFVGMSTEIEWIVLALAENDEGAVLTERIDKFLVNGTWIELPVMGTFEVADGRITAWRDYFDLADFQQQMAAATGS